MANEELIARGPYPAKAEFHCAPYSDGSGHNIVVGYDTTENGNWGRHIRLNGYAITFPLEATDEVIAAIRYCETALRARHGEGEG